MRGRGRILVADHDGTYLLRFEGDVRLTLCVAIDDFLQQMFAAPRFTAVVIDLSHARYLDSTSLGTLAKLAKESRCKTARAPILVCPDGDVMRALTGLGIDELFERGGAEFTKPPAATALGPIETNDPSEDDIRARVLEAHRVLMALNPSNTEQFSDLVARLEALDAPDRASASPARSTSEKPI